MIRKKVCLVAQAKLTVHGRRQKKPIEYEPNKYHTWKKNRHPDNWLPKSGPKKRRQTDKTISKSKEKTSKFLLRHSELKTEKG